MRTGIALALICFLSTLTAQPIVIEQFDETLLEQEILYRINRHRKVQGLTALQPDNALAEAASDQVFYLDYLGDLTHDQSIESKSTPLKRVRYFEGMHDPVGESVAYVSFGNFTYPSVAERLYLYWKQSPADYENMISYTFDQTAIRFSIDTDRQRIYAVQVYGGSAFASDSNADFGDNPGNTIIKPYQATLCGNVDAYAAVAGSLPNRLSIQGDSVFLDYRDADLLRNVIPNRSDGLALDILTRDQISCGGGNQFHFSKVHDGYLQPVVYSNQLFSNNRYYGGNRLYTFLGLIPSDLSWQDIQINVITINNNSACQNSYPVDIPQGETPFFMVPPIWAFQELADMVDNKKLILNEKKIPPGKQVGKEKLKRRFPLYFDNNEELLALEDLNDIQQFVNSQKDIIDTVEITLFSSIEGNRNSNLAYQEDRAREIQSILNEVGISASRVVVRTEENWPLFYRQIRNTSWADYRNLNRQEVKDRLRNNQVLRQLSGFLREQRKGEVLVKYSREKPQRFAIYQNVKTTEASKQKIRQFEKFVKERQYDNALAAQHNLIQAFLNFELNRKDLLSLNVPVERSFLPHLSNMLAVEIFYSDKLNTGEAFQNRLRKIWMLDADYLPMEFNFNAYAVRYLQEFNEAITSVKELEFNLQDLLESKRYPAAYLDKENSIKRLIANYHMAAVDYYAGSRDYQLRDRALKEAKDYAANCKLNQQETLDLALFFNREYYIDWSLELLKPYFVTGKFSEDLLFTYTQTRALADDALRDTKFVNLLKLCQRRNPMRFCKWMNDNFQLMRSDMVKQLYCQTCD